MIDCIETAQDLNRLAAEWNELLAESRADCFFLTWEWLSAWWQHLAGNRSLSVLRVRSGGELLALIPLAREKPRISTLHYGSLCFLGSGLAGSDYLDFIIRRDDEPRVLAEVADYLARRNCLLNLTQLRRNGAAAAALAGLWKDRGGQLAETATHVCPVIGLAGHSWDSYLGSLSSAQRYNFRRRLRQLSSRFSMRFEQVRCEAQRSTALEHLIALHNLRRDTLDGSDAFHTPQLRAFHQTLSKLALQRGWLRLFTLWLDDHAAASLYGFFYNGVFYFYQCGFDPAYSDHSVGLVTMGLAIQGALDEGAREYDLLHGAERYKFHWANEVRELVRLELYPPGLRGALCKQSRELARKTKSMARKMLRPNRKGEAPPPAEKEEKAVYAARPT